jgi:hypothetical protein
MNEDLTQDQVDAAAAAEQAEMERAQVEHLKARVVLLRAQLDLALAENERLQEQQNESTI